MLKLNKAKIQIAVIQIRLSHTILLEIEEDLSSTEKILDDSDLKLVAETPHKLSNQGADKLSSKLKGTINI